MDYVLKGGEKSMNKALDLASGILTLAIAAALIMHGDYTPGYFALTVGLVIVIFS